MQIPKALHVWICALLCYKYHNAIHITVRKLSVAARASVTTVSPGQAVMNKQQAFSSAGVKSIKYIFATLPPHLKGTYYSKLTFLKKQVVKCLKN